MQTFDNIFGAKARNKLTIFWTKLHTLALVLALLLTSDKCLSSLPPLPDLLSINMRNKKPLHIYIRDCNFPLKDHCARYFFARLDTKIGEKVNFLVKCSVTENFQVENFSGLVPNESLCTQDSGLGD